MIDDILSLGGGIFGNLLGSGDDARARQQYLDALSQLQQTNVEAPSTAYDSISMDPATRAAQMSALQSLQSEADRGGMSVNDRVAQAQAMTAAAQQERGSREALNQEMAARGMRGSGYGYAAALANQQGAASRNAATGATTAANARTRALQSLQEAGQLGGQVRGQDWQQASARAQAQDAINKFNAGQRLNKADATARGYGNVAGAYSQQAQQTRDTWGGLGKGLGGIYDSYQAHKKSNGGYADSGEWV